MKTTQEPRLRGASPRILATRQCPSSSLRPFGKTIGTQSGAVAASCADMASSSIQSGLPARSMPGCGPTSLKSIMVAPDLGGRRCDQHVVETKALYYYT